MSRPRIWNGSAWIDPKFWAPNNGGWRSYVAPSWAPMGNWDFNDGTIQGWSTNPYLQGGAVTNGGGFVQCQATQSGLFSSVSLESPYLSYLRGHPAGTAYRGRWSVNIQRLSGNDSQPVTVSFSVGDSSSEFTRPAGNSGWFEHMSPIAYTEEFRSLGSMVFQISAGALSANSIYRIMCDWAFVADANGNVIYDMTDEGWQPLVFDGSDWV